MIASLVSSSNVKTWYLFRYSILKSGFGCRLVLSQSEIQFELYYCILKQTLTWICLVFWVLEVPILVTGINQKSCFQPLTTQYSKSELVSRVNFDRNISPNSKGRSPIFLLGWPALGDCSICDIIPSNLSSGSFFYLPIWQAAVFEVGCHTMACPSFQVIFWKTNH